MEVKRVKRMERLAQINNGDNRGIAIKGGSLFGISGAIIFFVIGIFVYGDFFKGVMLGVFSFVSNIVSVLYMIPFLGIILWIIGVFVWGWGITLANILNIEINWAVQWAWWMPSIAFFVIGIVLTLAVIIVVASKIIGEPQDTIIFGD